VIDSYRAAGNIAYQLGYLTAAVGIPLVGLTLLIVGLSQRSRSRARRTAYPPPYPSYPPPSGYPPNAGYPGPPPPPGVYPGYPTGYPPARTGSSGTALIAIGVVLLVFGGVGIAGRAASVGSRTSTAIRSSTAEASPSAKPTSLQVGQCITESSYRTGFIGSGPFDCTDPASNYELAARVPAGGACPDGKSDGSVYDRLTNDSNTLCFLPNLKEGKCYTQTPGPPTETVSPVDCTDTQRSQLKVAQRIDGSTDASLCPPGTKAIDFPRPARLYCFGTGGS
jgi:hypothetical protein